MRADELPEPVLASIADYYRRATTTSRPMSRLIAVVMVILLGGLVFQGVRGHDPVWLTAMSAALAGVPILLALIRTVPNADSARCPDGRTRRTVAPGAVGLPRPRRCASSSSRPFSCSG